MNDALAYKLFGLIFCVFGALGLLTSLMIPIYMRGVSVATPAIWITLIMGLGAIAGGVGLMRHAAIARYAMMAEAAVVLCAAVIGAVGALSSEPMKAIVLMTGVMPAVLVIAILYQLGRSDAMR